MMSGERYKVTNGSERACANIKLLLDRATFLATVEPRYKHVIGRSVPVLITNIFL